MKAICGAKTRAAGQCQKSPVAGRNRCRLHGGRSAVPGPTHPGWKHGRYSLANVPKPLREFLERAANDPDLMSLRQEIVLVQATIAESLKALGDLPKDGTPPIHEYRRISELCLKKAALVESESKRLEQLGQMLSAERAHQLVGQILVAIRSTVQDQATILELGRKLEAVLGAATRNRIA